MGFLLGVDLTGDGKVTIADHNPDFARHTAAWVPGLGATIDGLRGNIARVHDLRTAADELTTAPGDVSTVMWLGYDAPEGIVSVALSVRVKAGAGPLIQSIDGLRLAHNDEPYHVTAMAHSYGSTVVAGAALTGRMHRRCGQPRTARRPRSTPDA